MVILRWIIWISILLTEMILLSIRFDTGSLTEEHAWWAQFLGAAPLWVRIGSTIAAAMLFCAGVRLWIRRDPILAELRAPFDWRPALLWHVAALAGFYLLTRVVLEGEIQNTRWPQLWVACWIVALLATGVSWAFGILSPRLWREVLRREWAALLLGALIGAVAAQVGWLTEQLWNQLGQGTLSLVHWCLQGAYAETIYQPAEKIIGTPLFYVHIAPECSGYQGIGLITVFLTTYIWLFRRSLYLPQSLVLIPLGAFLVWLLNSLRIVALVMLGTAGHRELALGAFHSQAGWLVFLIVALGLVTASRQWAFLARAPAGFVSAQPAEDAVNWTAAYLCPFLAILLIAGITGSLQTGFDPYYPMRVAAGALVIWFYRKAYAECRTGFSPQSIVFGAAAAFVWLICACWLRPGEPETISNGLAGWSTGQRTTWLACKIAGYVMLAPFAEELAFRGYLMRRLSSPAFLTVPLEPVSWLPLLVSSAAFGALHGAAWVGASLAGLLFGLAMIRGRRLTDAIVAHAICNSSIAVYVLTTGDWSVWG